MTLDYTKLAKEWYATKKDVLEGVPSWSWVLSFSRFLNERASREEEYDLIGTDLGNGLHAVVKKPREEKPSTITPSDSDFHAKARGEEKPVCGKLLGRQDTVGSYGTVLHGAGPEIWCNEPVPCQFHQEKPCCKDCFRTRIGEVWCDNPNCSCHRKEESQYEKNANLHREIDEALSPKPERKCTCATMFGNHIADCPLVTPSKAECEHDNTFVSKSTKKGTRKICHDCGYVFTPSKALEELDPNGTTGVDGRGTPVTLSFVPNEVIISKLNEVIRYVKELEKKL